MLDTVIQVVAEQLNVLPESLDSESSYTTVPNWDSLATMRIVLALEQIFNVSLSTKEMVSIQSIRGIMDTLASKNVEGL